MGRSPAGSEDLAPEDFPLFPIWCTVPEQPSVVVLRLAVKCMYLTKNFHQMLLRSAPNKIVGYPILEPLARSLPRVLFGLVLVVALLYGV